MNTTPLLDLLSHTALKGAAVLLVALLLGLILRRMAAARRYALWITAIVTLAVLPLAMWALPAWRVLPKASAKLEWPVLEPELVSESAEPIMLPEDRVTLPASQTALAPVPVETGPSFAWKISWQDAVQHLPLAWAIVASLLLLRLGWSAWHLRRLEATLHSGECEMLVQTARMLGLKRMPRLLIGPEDAVPMVWGVLRPRLLLPQGFETWSPEKQRGVLLHELAHLKRGDPLALWAAQWVKALHWFNPLIWLTFRALRADQERACDDAVLCHGVRASEYAQHLLDLSQHTRVAPGLALCALTITRCSPVEARVKAILDVRRSREGLTRRWVLGLCGVALLGTVPVAMLHAIEGATLRGRILDRNGVVLAESMPERMRSYPLQTLTAHVVGYTGKTGPEDATPAGRFALEKQHDAMLRKGKDLSLTLDARVQALATRALNENIQHGAIVIMDPESGGILAYISVPSYDPNRFIPTLNAADWENYTRDKDMPLFDRVSTSRAAPGAIFQPMTALAAFASGKNPGTYECAPLTREAGGGVRFGNTTKICRISLQDGAAHGPLTLEQALSKSCSSYFFQLGTEAGYPALLTTAGHLGLQRDTDIFGAKSVPVMPAQEKVAKTHSSPRQLTDITAAFASGNGSAVSVLQMAVLYSALANGKVWDPTLIQNDGGQPRLDLNSLPGLPEGLARVRSALQNAVNDPKGCARAAASAKVEIAALSDTHVTGQKGPHSEVFTHHHWVGGYVPAAKPALAFALYMDETSANRSADPAKLGPIIRRIVEETLALPADGSGEVKPVEVKSVEVQAKTDIKVVPTPHQVFNKTTAKVIGRSSSTSSNSLVIDKGSLDGIVADRPVIALGGVVGKTTAPEAHTTKVILLTDELCRLSAKVEGTLEQGILAGERAAQAGQPQLRLRFLSRDAKINIGSRVYSSGEGGIFPVDQLLGRVKEFISGDVSGEAIVEPAVDFSTLDEVFVMEVETGAPDQGAVIPPRRADQAQDAGKMKFDAEDISRQIRLLANKAGVSLRDFKMGDGRLSMIGLSTKLDEARMFGDLLTQNGRRWRIAWHVTPPQNVPDRPLTMFMAVGVYPTDSIRAAISPPPNTSVSAVGGVVSPMSNWRTLQKFGKLADLPADYAPERIMPTESLPGAMTSMMYAFTASRKAVHAWLSASLPAKRLAAHADKLRELSETESFQHEFWSQDGCRVRVVCAEDKARVLVSRWTGILIAPDESQKPRPAGRLASDYRQEGLTSAKPAVPKLEGSVPRREPTISPEEALKRRAVSVPPVRSREIPAPTRVKPLPMSVRHLSGGLSAESEKALQRSSRMNNRMQQSLVVISPE